MDWSIASGIVTFLGVIICLKGVKGGPVLTADPPAYIPKEGFSLRCKFGGDSEGVSDIISITVGKSGRNPLAMAGISDTEGTLISHKIKERASASGLLNHTHFRESYIDLHLNETTCSDLGDYFCTMAIIDAIIVHAVKIEFKYSLKDGESCLQIDTSSGQGQTRSYSGNILSMYIFISSFLRMRDW